MLKKQLSSSRRVVGSYARSVVGNETADAFVPLGLPPSKPPLDLDRLSRKHHALRIEGEVDRAVDPALNAQRLLRLAEVSTMVGLRRSAICQHISEGDFPLRSKWDIGV